MRDQRTVVTDQGMHAAERVLPIGVGEFAGEGLDDHAACVVASLVVEVGGVDQAGGVDTADARSTDIVRRHTAVLPGLPNVN
jgi:hypothetical protein